MTDGSNLADNPAPVLHQQINSGPRTIDHWSTSCVYLVTKTTMGRCNTSHKLIKRTRSAFCPGSVLTLNISESRNRVLQNHVPFPLQQSGFNNRKSVFPACYSQEFHKSFAKKRHFPPSLLNNWKDGIGTRRITPSISGRRYFGYKSHPSFSISGTCCELPTSSSSFYQIN